MKLWQEFKAFAFKGNLVDLAVAVVIGTAFTAVVTSLVQDVVMPIISHYVLPAGQTYQKWAPGGVAVGKFIAALVNFLLVAIVVFIVLVKFLGALMKRPEAPPQTKNCPLCLSAIPLQAKKCAHCTADLPQGS